MLRYSDMQSPIGRLLLAGDGERLHRIDFDGAADPAWRRDDRALAPVRRQLEAYFAGRLVDFELPLAPDGTAFQHKVWDALCRIPYGGTVSYAELARSIGQPAAARAVGTANGRNPIPIIIPCHRVVAAGGKRGGPDWLRQSGGETKWSPLLGGYGGGLDKKRTLLDLEARVRPRGLASRAAGA